VSDKSIHQAFIEAYAEMTNPKKNASNPAFKSKYANLEELIAVTRPILTAVGLALVQQPVSEDGAIGVHSYLMAATGETIDFGSYTVPLAKHDAQGAGSALTYTRRYSIAAIFGLAQEDDDGNAAAKPQPKNDAKPQPVPETKPQPAVKSAKPSTLAELRGLRKELAIDDDKYASQLEWANGAPVTTDEELTQPAADKLLKAYKERLAAVAELGGDSE
jgi:hypothetical protein